MRVGEKESAGTDGPRRDHDGIDLLGESVLPHDTDKIGPTEKSAHVLEPVVEARAELLVEPLLGRCVINVARRGHQ